MSGVFSVSLLDIIRNYLKGVLHSFKRSLCFVLLCTIWSYQIISNCRVFLSNIFQKDNSFYLVKYVIACVIPKFSGDSLVKF